MNRAIFIGSGNRLRCQWMRNKTSYGRVMYDFQRSPLHFIISTHIYSYLFSSYLTSRHEHTGVITALCLHDNQLAECTSTGNICIWNQFATMYARSKASIKRSKIKSTMLSLPYGKLQVELPDKGISRADFPVNSPISMDGVRVILSPSEAGSGKISSTAEVGKEKPFDYRESW